MKTLIIHPHDPSTKFLEGLYHNLPEKTVVTGGISKSELPEIILSHDRIVMMGHGSPSGLFSVGQFPDSYPYIIDDSLVMYLKNKSNILYIWCHASEFVNRNSLQGFCTEMMISEINEALWYDFPYTDDLENIIQESNYGFSTIVGRNINEPLDILYKNLIREYSKLGMTNTIAEFNSKRIFLLQAEHCVKTHMVRNTK